MQYRKKQKAMRRSRDRRKIVHRSFVIIQLYAFPYREKGSVFLVVAVGGKNAHVRMLSYNVSECLQPCNEKKLTMHSRAR
jgi:hypothetical protein